MWLGGLSRGTILNGVVSCDRSVSSFLWKHIQSCDWLRSSLAKAASPFSAPPPASQNKQSVTSNLITLVKRRPRPSPCQAVKSLSRRISIETGSYHGHRDTLGVRFHVDDGGRATTWSSPSLKYSGAHSRYAVSDGREDTPMAFWSLPTLRDALSRNLGSLFGKSTKWGKLRDVKSAALTPWHFRISEDVLDYAS